MNDRDLYKDGHGFRDTWSRTVHPEPDANYRGRLLRVAIEADKDAIEIAGAFELDAFGRKYGLRRHGVAR